MEYGYELKWNTDGSYSTSITMDYNKINEESLYFINNSERALAYWIASPSYTDDSTIFGVYCDTITDVIGLWDGYYHNANNVGICPVVCLKSNIQLQKQADGSFQIVN